MTPWTVDTPCGGRLLIDRDAHGDAARLDGVDLGDGTDWAAVYRAVATELGRCAEHIKEDTA